MKRSSAFLISVAFIFFSSLFVNLAFSQQDGAAAFKQKCVICHGADGSGKTKAAVKMPMPDLRSAEVQKLTDDQLFESIALGKDHNLYPHTYLYKGLNEDQIHGIVRYLRQLAANKNGSGGTVRAR